MQITQNQKTGNFGFDPRKNILEENRTNEWQQFPNSDGELVWFQNCWIEDTPVRGTLSMEWVPQHIAEAALGGLTGSWHQDTGNDKKWDASLSSHGVPFQQHDAPAKGAQPIGAPAKKYQEGRPLPPTPPEADIRRPPPPDVDHRQWPGVEPRGETHYGTWGPEAATSLPPWKSSASPKMPDFKKGKPWHYQGRNYWWSKTAGFEDKGGWVDSDGNDADL